MSDSSRHMRPSINGSDNKIRSKFEPLRQQRKRNKVTKYGSEPNKEESGGIYTSDGQDVCDCLDQTCSGCFFKCPNKKCKSNKCGPDCRLKRKFYYQSIEDPIDPSMKRVAKDMNRTVIHIV